MAGKRFKVGGVAIRTFLALGAGVALWFVVAGMFPQIAAFTRGTGTGTSGGFFSGIFSA